MQQKGAKGRVYRPNLFSEAMILANWRGLFEEPARSTCTIRFAKVSGFSRGRTTQRRALNLEELNTTQIERCQRSIEVD
jgi:hypothetical protein